MSQCVTLTTFEIRAMLTPTAELCSSSRTFKENIAVKRNNAIVKALPLFVMAAISLTLLASIPAQSHRVSTQSNQRSVDKDNEEKQQMPIARYDTPQPSNRAIKSARYNGPGSQVIDERVQPLPLISHWWWGMSPFPTDQSDAVVVGEVVEASAYLSDDKTNVYSEFTIRIEDVLKSSGATGFVPGESVIAQRPGGGVQFASGRIHYYRISGQNTPRTGRRYILFLKLNDPPEAFSIVTGYELQNGRVSPLDSVEAFEAYDQHPEIELLNLVRTAVSREPAKLTKKGGQIQ